MSINNFEINLMKYLQECEVLNLLDGEKKFFKTSNSLKRNIQNINSYLPDNRKFYINGNTIESKIDYRYFLFFLDKLTLQEYSPTPNERINLLLIKGFFENCLNKSEVYLNINVSLTTLKKDTLDLKAILKEHELEIVNIPKKGVRIAGNELNYRFLVTSILFNLTDLKSQGEVYSSGSLSPLEKVFTQHSIEKLKTYILKGNYMLNTILESLNSKLSYKSKKFLTIYLAITLFRIDKEYVIKEIKNIDLSTFNSLPFKIKNENLVFNYLFASSDFSTKNLSFYNKNLEVLTELFLAEVQNKIVTKMLFEKEIFQEVYDFLYKNIIRCKLKYHLYDDKLENTEKILRNLFNINSECLIEIEDNFNIKFSFSQIATLTIILKKYITKSKLVGRNRKRVVIVSNSSSEKIAFFIERLKLHIEIDIIECVSIDELDQLRVLDFDIALTFSNRIKLLLEDMSIDTIKLSFYLEINDIEKLLANGFSRTRRKMLANEVAKSIQGKDEIEIEEILKKKFSEYFI